MEATTYPPRDDRPREACSPRGIACPFCDGVLVPRGGTFRCLRCSFSICTGCEDVAPLDCAGPPG
jgi:hypothetical protein